MGDHFKDIPPKLHNNLRHAQNHAKGKTYKGSEVTVLTTDVLIVGTGPIGAVFAQKLVAAGKKVLMIDIGEQATRRIGDHKKNSVAVQRDISLFTNAVRGELRTLSVPTNTTRMYLEPSSWSPCTAQIGCLQNGQNPDQDAWDNLPAAAASRVVGGMGSHWTCCTPRAHKLERSDLFTDKEWNTLYSDAETLFRTNSTSFDDSIRQQLVKHVLADAYKHVKRPISSMPLACKRSETNDRYIEWTSPAVILGELSEPGCVKKPFKVLPNTQLVRLNRDSETNKGDIVFATVRDLLENKEHYIVAEKYVVCAGAILTPGILYNSNIWKEELPVLGHYMTEQIMAFCQIILKTSLVDNVINDPYHLGWTQKVKDHQNKFPNDPLPFPFDDPDPQCYFPFTETHQWHTQIHRDAFGYGEVPPTIDQRLVVDFRWFTQCETRKENWLDFSNKVRDEFGMPQPTFHFRPSDDDADRCQRMITDMVEVARNLGGFLPGAEPKCLVPGSAAHICGTYRAGRSKEDSVVNREGKVWGFSNLVLGGCGVIPTAMASNPTITAACFALAAADEIIKEFA